MSPNQKKYRKTYAGSISRRDFSKSLVASAFAFNFFPKSTFGANSRLQVASIGIGGKGFSDVSGIAGAGGHIVALCDVHDKRRVKKGNKDHTLNFPKAKFFRDFRKMLESMDSEIDAVSISTPDHTHFHPARMAIMMGKHVYCQKPLTHSIWEARELRLLARKHKVRTQMGNQAHAGEPIRRAVEYIRSGLLGRVKEVHCWTNRPIWAQGMKSRPAGQKIEKGLDWDLWLGPAPETPYSSKYLPFSWRGWWDYGTGALGDMGCHIMDMPYWALDLGNPISVSASSRGNSEYAGPNASVVTYKFPRGPYSDALTFHWYDGNNRPDKSVYQESGLTQQQLSQQFESIIVGDRGKLYFQRGGMNWKTTPSDLLKDWKKPIKSIPRVKNEDQEWVDACLGKSGEALSRFEYSGRLTETVLLGNLAIRLNKKVEWNGRNLSSTNSPGAASLIKRAYRKGWEV